MVEDNHGQICIESQEGHGTKVILTFLPKTAEMKSGQELLDFLGVSL